MMKSYCTVSHNLKYKPGMFYFNYTIIIRIRLSFHRKFTSIVKHFVLNIWEYPVPLGQKFVKNHIFI